MPTSSDSPTAGELTTTATGNGPEPTKPEVKDAADSNAVVADEETNFPAHLQVAEEDRPAEVEEDPSAEAVKDDGSTWATWDPEVPGISRRELTVADLRQLGDKETATSLVWSPDNRYQVDVSTVHPLVLRYLEQQDGRFKIERF